MLETNNNGILRNKYVKKEALKMLIVGPLFSIGYIALSFISMYKWTAFFYIIAPFLFIMMIFFFIVAPIVMLNRHNRTIEEISFEETNLTFKVFQALWMDSKLIKVNKKEIKIIKSKFQWYGKEKKDGYILKLGHNQEYYLVLDYFTDKEQVINNLF